MSVRRGAFGAEREEKGIVRALKLVGLWIFLPGASFLIGALIISPIISYVSPAHNTPAANNPAPAATSAATASPTSPLPPSNFTPPTSSPSVAAPNTDPDIRLRTEENDRSHRDVQRSQSPDNSGPSASENYTAPAEGNNGDTGANPDTGAAPADTQAPGTVDRSGDQTTTRRDSTRSTERPRRRRTRTRRETQPAPAQPSDNGGQPPIQPGESLDQ